MLFQCRHGSVGQHSTEAVHAVLQGVRDDVVDISAGRALHAAALNPVEPLWAQNCDHQNVESDPQYVTRLKDFIRQVFK